MFWSTQGSGAGGEINQQPWAASLEKYEFVWTSGDNYCIRSATYENYVRPQGSSLNYIIDTQTFCGPWEKFEIVVLAEPLYIDINYKIDEAAILELSPMLIATQVLDNRDSDIE